MGYGAAACGNNWLFQGSGAGPPRSSICTVIRAVGKAEGRRSACLRVPGSECRSVGECLCICVSGQGFGSVWSEFEGVGDLQKLAETGRAREGYIPFLGRTWKTLTLPSPALFHPGSSLLSSPFDKWWAGSAGEPEPVCTRGGGGRALRPGFPPLLTRPVPVGAEVGSGTCLHVLAVSTLTTPFLPPSFLSLSPTCTGTYELSRGEFRISVGILFMRFLMLSLDLFSLVNFMRW